MATIKYNNGAAYIPAHTIEYDSGYMIVQERGQGTNSVMSQKAVSDELGRVGIELKRKLGRSEARLTYQPIGDYVTEEGLDGTLSDYALKSDIPTKVGQFINDRGYLTAHQSLEDYYTKEEIDSMAPFIRDGQEAFFRLYVKKSEVEDLLEKHKYDDSGLKDRLEGLEDVDHEGNLKTALSDYYTKDESDDRYVTGSAFGHECWVIDQRLSSLESIDHSQFITEHQSLEDYLKKAEAAEAYQPIGQYVSQEDLELTLAGYAMKSYADDCRYNDHDVKQRLLALETGMRLVDDLDIENRLNAIESIDEDDLRNELHANYYTADDCDARYQPKGNYLTAHQSLAGYAMLSDVENARYDDHQIKDRLLALETGISGIDGILDKILGE